MIWANGADWQAQDDAEGLLDAEEIPFYAEGLLMEGFAMQWQVLAETEAPKDPVHIRLFFWQTGGATPPVLDTFGRVSQRVSALQYRELSPPIPWFAEDSLGGESPLDVIDRRILPKLPGP